MKITKRIATLLGVLVVGLFVFGLAATAVGGYGSSSDPLITLSYLTEVFTPEMDVKIAEKVDEKAAELTSSLDTRLTALEQKLGAAESIVVAANYTPRQLSAGQTLRLGTGTELLLRSGGASCSAEVTDLSASAALAAAGAMTANHLYMTTAEETVLTATADTLLLLRGAYILG